jgi:PAS domain S-box-containing protein
MSFVAWRGLSEGYRKAVRGHSPWKPGQRDPQPIFVADIERTEEPDWIKATIKAEGIRGLAFIPLVCHGEVVGKFMTYYKAPHDFAEHEINLAVTIARQVGFSLERARAAAARRAAEEELRESEERFRLMSEHAPVMIWLSGVQGECLHLNQMLRSFWNVDSNAIDRFDWQDMMHPDDAPEIGRLMDEALAKHESVTIKGRYRDSQGRYRVMQTDARPRFSASGEFLGMIGVNVDVTEREEAERHLRESEERFRLAVEAAPSGMVMTIPRAASSWSTRTPRSCSDTAGMNWPARRSSGWCRRGSRPATRPTDRPTASSRRRGRWGQGGIFLPGARTGRRFPSRSA